MNERFPYAASVAPGMATRAAATARSNARGPKRIAVLTALLVPLLSGCASAGTGGGVAGTWPADEAAIRAAMRASADAWNRGDLAGHLAIYVDSLTFMTPDGPQPGVDALADAFAASYFRDGQPVQDLGFDAIEVRRLDTDAALVTGRFILSGGDQPEQSGWYTLVWLRTADGWRAIHDHSG